MDFGSLPFVLTTSLRDANGVWLHSHGVSFATREEAESVYASFVRWLGLEMVEAK